MTRRGSKPKVPSLALPWLRTAATEPPNALALSKRLLPACWDLALLLVVALAGLSANWAVSSLSPYFTGQGTMLDAGVKWLEVSNCTRVANVSIVASHLASSTDVLGTQVCSRYQSLPEVTLDHITAMRRAMDIAWGPAGLHALALVIAISHAAAAVQQRLTERDVRRLVILLGAIVVKLPMLLGTAATNSYTVVPVVGLSPGCRRALVISNAQSTLYMTGISQVLFMWSYVSRKRVHSHSGGWFSFLCTDRLGETIAEACVAISTALIAAVAMPGAWFEWGSAVLLGALGLLTVGLFILVSAGVSRAFWRAKRANRVEMYDILCWSTRWAPSMLLSVGGLITIALTPAFLSVLFPRPATCPKWLSAPLQNAPTPGVTPGIPAGASWPSGLDPTNPDDIMSVVATCQATALYGVLAAIPIVAMALATLIDAQHTLLRRREAEEDKARLQLEAALSYVSHEARGPLNAAMLSMTLYEAELMDQAQDMLSSSEDMASTRELRTGPLFRITRTSSAQSVVSDTDQMRVARRSISSSPWTTPEASSEIAQTYALFGVSRGPSQIDSAQEAATLQEAPVETMIGSKPPLALRLDTQNASTGVEITAEMSGDVTAIATGSRAADVQAMLSHVVGSAEDESEADDDQDEMGRADLLKAVSAGVLATRRHLDDLVMWEQVVGLTKSDLQSGARWTRPDDGILDEAVTRAESGIHGVQWRCRVGWEGVLCAGDPSGVSSGCLGADGTGTRGHSHTRDAGTVLPPHPVGAIDAALPEELPDSGAEGVGINSSAWSDSDNGDGVEGLTSSSTHESPRRRLSMMHGDPVSCLSMLMRICCSVCFDAGSTNRVQPVNDTLPSDSVTLTRSPSRAPLRHRITSNTDASTGASSEGRPLAHHPTGATSGRRSSAHRSTGATSGRRSSAHRSTGAASGRRSSAHRSTGSKTSSSATRGSFQPQARVVKAMAQHDKQLGATFSRHCWSMSGRRFEVFADIDSLVFVVHTAVCNSVQHSGKDPLIDVVATVVRDAASLANLPEPVSKPLMPTDQSGTVPASNHQSVSHKAESLMLSDPGSPPAHTGVLDGDAAGSGLPIAPAVHAVGQLRETAAGPREIESESHASDRSPVLTGYAKPSSSSSSSSSILVNPAAGTNMTDSTSSTGQSNTGARLFRVRRQVSPARVPSPPARVPSSPWSATPAALGDSASGSASSSTKEMTALFNARGASTHSAVGISERQSSEQDLHPVLQQLGSSTNERYPSLVKSAGSATLHDHPGQLCPRQAVPFRAVLVLEVRDTGVGVDKALMQSGNLFEPFRVLNRGNDALLSKSGGLSLAVAARLIKAVGGTLTIQSRSGRGTVMAAHVPVWAREASPGSFQESSRSVLHSGRRGSSLGRSALSRGRSYSRAGSVGNSTAESSLPPPILSAMAQQRALLQPPPASSSRDDHYHRHRHDGGILASSPHTAKDSASAAIAPDPTMVTAATSGSSPVASDTAESESVAGDGVAGTPGMPRSHVDAGVGQYDQHSRAGSSAPDRPTPENRNPEEGIPNGIISRQAALQSSEGSFAALSNLGSSSRSRIVIPTVSSSARGSHTPKHAIFPASPEPARMPNAPESIGRDTSFPFAVAQIPREPPSLHLPAPAGRALEALPEEDAKPTSIPLDAKLDSQHQLDSLPPIASNRASLPEATSASTRPSLPEATSASTRLASGSRSRSSSRAAARLERETRRAERRRVRGSNPARGNGDLRGSAGRAKSESLPVWAVGRSVMVVDDERMQRRLLAALLSRWRLQPLQCINGAAAVAQLRLLAALPAEQWPVAVTLDVEMPVLDGKGVLRERRRLARLWRVQEQSEKCLAVDSAAPAGVVIAGATAEVEASGIAVEATEAGRSHISSGAVSPAAPCQIDRLESSTIHAAKPRPSTASVLPKPAESVGLTTGLRQTSSRIGWGEGGSDRCVSSADDTIGGVGDAIGSGTIGGVASPSAVEGVPILEDDVSSADAGSVCGIASSHKSASTTASHAACPDRHAPLPGASRRLRRLPIVVVTGNAREGDRRELLELGADLVVSKPVEPAVLFEALCKLMRHK